MEMITLMCPECKGTLQVDPDKMLIQCPYCGNGKLIIEDKEITLKRLDIQKKKLEMEDAERKYQREKEDLKESDKETILIWVFAIVGWMIFGGFLYFLIR